MNYKLRATLTEYCGYSITLHDLVKRLLKNKWTLPKPGGGAGRAVYTDRPEIAHPLEETGKDRLMALLGVDSIPDVIIQYGGLHQETLRSAGAVALTRGHTVAIREEAYNTGTIFTDAVLLHEMVHIIQEEEDRRLTTKDEVEEAEREAAAAEGLAEAGEGGYYYAELGGKLYYMNKEIERQAIDYAARRLKEMAADAARRGDVEFLCALQDAFKRNI